MKIARYVLPLLFTLTFGCGTANVPQTQQLKAPAPSFQELASPPSYGLLDLSRAYALYAGSTDKDALKFSGHENAIAGDLGSNGGIQIDAKKNTLACGKAYPNLGSAPPKGDKSQQACQDFSGCYPIAISVGAIRQALQKTPYTFVPHNLHLDDFVHNGVLPSGIYVSLGQLSLSQSNVTAKGVTLIAYSIHISGHDNVFTPDKCDLLMYAADCHGAPMYVSGSHNCFTGLIDSPNASFHISGSDNTFTGKLQALTFQVSGSGNHFTAPGAACHL